MNIHQQIIFLALIRIWIIFIGYFSGNYYRSEIDLYLENNGISYWMIPFIKFMFVYDSRYFLEVIKLGYSYDMIHAFMPGFPAFVKIITLFRGLTLGELALAIFMINFIINVGIIFYMNKLIKLITKNPFIHSLSLKFFLLSPVTIYYTSSYSECLFLFIQTFGIF